MAALEQQPHLWAQLVQWLRGIDLLPLLQVCHASEFEARRELRRENSAFAARHLVHLSFWLIGPERDRIGYVASYFPRACEILGAIYPFSPIEPFAEPLVGWTRLFHCMRNLASVDKCMAERKPALRELARAARAVLRIGPRCAFFFRHLERPSPRPIEDGRCWILEVGTGDGDEIPSPERCQFVPANESVRARQAFTRLALKIPAGACSLRVSTRCDGSATTQCGWCRFYSCCLSCSYHLGGPSCWRCSEIMVCCPPRECAKCRMTACWRCSCLCASKRVKLLPATGDQ